MLKLKQTNYIDEFEKGPIRRSLFSNGAVSLFHHAKEFSGAVVQLHFLAGSIFENEQQAGLAHLIEHLYFKENDSELIKYMELSGAAINAYTYKENVCFELSCNSTKLPELLKKFLEKFFSLDFTSEQLKKEKKVIMQEIRDDLDDHETQAIEKIFLKNFDYNYGHQVGGKISAVQNYTEEDIKKFHKKYFTPERMILVVVSGKEYDGLEDDFRNSMNRFKLTSAKDSFRLKAYKNSKTLNHFKSTQKRKMENSILAYAFDGPSLNCHQYYDFVVLDEFLFEGLNSLFFKKLREEKPLIYALGSSLNSFSKYGNFIMIFNTKGSNLEELQKSCEEIFHQVGNEDFPEDELEQIKNRILDNWELSFDDLEERAEFMAGSEIYQLEEFSINHVRDKIKNVTKKSIRKTFSKAYNNGYSQLIYKPM